MYEIASNSSFAVTKKRVKYAKDHESVWLLVVLHRMTLEDQQRICSLARELAA